MQDVLLRFYNSPSTLALIKLNDLFVRLYTVFLMSGSDCEDVSFLSL